MKISRGLNKFLNLLVVLSIVGLVVYLLATAFRNETELFIADYGMYILLVMTGVLLGLLVACFVLSIINFVRFAKTKNKDFLYKALRYLFVFPVVVVVLYSVGVYVIDSIYLDRNMRGPSGGFSTCYMPVSLNKLDSNVVNQKKKSSLASLTEKYKNNIPADVLEKIDRVK
ncbi:MAG: hypothetical protein ACOZAR_03360 [Patescibacteria group bacterium]